MRAEVPFVLAGRSRFPAFPPLALPAVFSVLYCGPMDTVILCGGLGTRLASLYPDRPKALVPVAGKPLLLRQLEWLMRAGVTEIHLAAGHLAQRLEEWLQLDAPHRSAVPELSLRLSAEPTPLGTAGAVKFVEPYLRTDPFLVLNGDTLVPNLDLRALLAVHRSAGAAITMAVCRRRGCERYGTVVMDAEGWVHRFLEKGASGEGWVNAGVYVMSRAVLAKVVLDRGPVSLEFEVLPRVAQEGRLKAWLCPPPLLDMGTPEGLREMEAYLSPSNE